MRLFVIALLGCPLIFLLGIELATATYGGATCDVTAAAPGASTKCTAQANGFCLIETLDLANSRSTGVCVCYSGYSGDKCQTASTETMSMTTVMTMMALGGIGAFIITKMGGTGNPEYGIYKSYHPEYQDYQVYQDYQGYGKKPYW